MKKIDVKLIKYSYGKFYVKGWSGDKHYKLLVKQVSGASLTPITGNYYIFSTDVNDLTITLPQGNSEYVEEFKILLNTGDSPNIELKEDGEYTYTKESIETLNMVEDTLYEIYGMYISQKWLITIKEI